MKASMGQKGVYNPMCAIAQEAALGALLIIIWGRGSRWWPCVAWTRGIAYRVPTTTPRASSNTRRPGGKYRLVASGVVLPRPAAGTVWDQLDLGVDDALDVL